MYRHQRLITSGKFFLLAALLLGSLAPQVHIGFEDIADEASTMGDSQVILQRLAEVQKLCIQCHAIYRLERE